MRQRPTPTSPTDPLNWADLFTRARLRKGWSYARLVCEADLPEITVKRACTTGRCHSATTLKLALALGLNVIPPFQPPLTGAQAQRG